MSANTPLRVVYGAWKPRLWSRVEWRYAIGLFTTAFFLCGAVTLFSLLLPSHAALAKSIAVVVVFIWRFVLDRLRIFPADWSRARGSSFSLLQALIDGFAFFVFFLVIILTLITSFSLREIAFAAVASITYGLYSGSFSLPKQNPN